MSNIVGDRRISAEQKSKDKAAKGAAKSGKADWNEKPKDVGNGEEPKNAVVVPENLEDYKGARKKLRHAVKAVVKANSGRIAEQLVTKAQQGDMRGTEMMLSLIDKKKQSTDGKKKKKRSGPNWAELLASEPEWDESMEENGGTKLAVVSGQ
jgi:hypothetical protein